MDVIGTIIILTIILSFMVYFYAWICIIHGFIMNYVDERKIKKLWRNK